jgi:hypothetical protein
MVAHHVEAAGDARRFLHLGEGAMREWTVSESAAYVLDLLPANPDEAAAVLTAVEEAFSNPGSQPIGWSGPTKLRVRPSSQAGAGNPGGDPCRRARCVDGGTVRLAVFDV